MTYSPFEVSRAIGTNISKQFQKQRESSAIEQILSNAMQTEDPAVLQQSIGQMLSKVSPERQGTAIQLLQGMVKNIQSKQQQQQQVTALERQRGLEPGSLSAFGGNLGMAEKISRPGKQTIVDQKYQDIRQADVADYVKSSMAQSDEALLMDQSLAEAERAIEGDISGPGFKALAKANPFTSILIGQTPDESALTAATKTLLSGTKGLFGSRPTEREIFLLVDGMLPSINKTPEANRESLRVIRKVNDFKKLKAQIVDDLTDGGAKFVPNLESLVSKQMEPIAKEFLEELKTLKPALTEKKAKPAKAKGKTEISLSQQLEDKTRARREGAKPQEAQQPKTTTQRPTRAAPEKRWTPSGML